MTRLGYWLAAMAALLVLWWECGENLAIFCYRMGVTLFSRVCPGRLLPPGGRAEDAALCSRPYKACSTPSTTLRD